jgi:hypothetical protein
MSQEVISASADLRRLQRDGYELRVLASGHLIIGHVPYLTESREVAYGNLVSTLELAGNVTVRPTDHVALFSGSTPCDREGRPLHKLINQFMHQQIAPAVEIDMSFSSKPPQGYADYFEKMTTYINLLAGPAQATDPSATAQTYAIVEPGDEPSVFRYLDTASSRAGVTDPSTRLAQPRIAIVGLGGTGSYILDLVAKTPVVEIHLFDGDDFLQHNAFRAPGAASLHQLTARPKKVDHWAAVHAHMRTGVMPHPHDLDESNSNELDQMSFVFIAIDRAPAKRAIIDHLEAAGISYIDVGMGVWRSEGGLGGSLRITTSTPEYRHAGNRIAASTAQPHDDYDSNIQIADLNALNAVLAVIRWKKACGFYADLEHEHLAIYEIDGNVLQNDEQS